MMRAPAPAAEVVHLGSGSFLGLRILAGVQLDSGSFLGLGILAED
jgi:tetrahydrodipicolinate N-succinyltransferase